MPGQWIRLYASDGFAFDAWTARPDGPLRGAVVVAQEIFGVNSHIRAVTERLAGERLATLVAEADAVLDCCDNFDTRHAVNRACVEHRVPLISGAAVRFSGQISVFDPRRTDSPCYHCLFPEGEDVEELRCAVTGIFAPLTGIIGSMQAAETLKLISGAGEPLVGRLLLLNGLTMEWRSVRFGKDPHCTVCAGPENSRL